MTTAAPPGIQVGPNRVEIQGHFMYLVSITQGSGGQDWEIQIQINKASQVFKSLKNSVFTSNHLALNSKLHLYVRLHGARTPHVWGSRVMGPSRLPGCPTGDLP